jgi:hypothetical protein
LVASFFALFLLGLTEELIFRGILQRSIEKVDPFFAIVLSALAFGAMHSVWVKPLEYVFTTYVGIILAVIYYRTRSLAIPVATHTVINFVLFQIIPYKL